jgi:aspartate carbamoyltransferase regulatory subunit
MKKDELSVKKIENGTVVDHIPAGNSPVVHRILGLSDSKNPVLTAMNVHSKKMGKKDIIKIEERFLEKDELDKLSFISEMITINIIKDCKVDEKLTVSLPRMLLNVVKCPNPKCITNFERMDTRFSPEKKVFRCNYCEKGFEKSEFSL